VCSAHGDGRWLDVSKGGAELHASGAARVWLSIDQCGVGQVGPNGPHSDSGLLFCSFPPFSFPAIHY
jgi:hypothetical protein